MGRKRFTSKTYLKLLIVAGILAVIGGGAGTFATFTAETTNANNVFANGTLFLHSTPDGGTTCQSESDLTGNSGTCTYLFGTTLANNVTSIAKLQLNDAGTIDASDIKFNIAGCTVAPNTTAAAGNTVPGTGSTVTFGTAPSCTDLRLAIQETASNYTTNVWCAYGTGSGNDCTIDAGHNLADATSVKTLKTTAGATATLAAAASRYYVIQINPSVASDNTLQNRKAQFDITWHIDQ
jgi:hypothetical protein